VSTHWVRIYEFKSQILERGEGPEQLPGTRTKKKKFQQDKNPQKIETLTKTEKKQENFKEKK
jgi:hypothetical protein